MAKIDVFISSLVPGEEFLLETNKEPSIRSSTGLNPVMNQALMTQHIKNMLYEIAGDAKAGVDSEAGTNFSYNLDGKNYQVSVMVKGDLMRAIIAPSETISTPAAAPPSQDNIEVEDNSDIEHHGEIEHTSAPQYASPAAVSAPPAAAQSAPVRAAAPPPSPAPGEGKEIDRLFHRMVELEASDLHLSSENRPMVRVHGELKELSEFPVLTHEMMQGLIFSIMPAKNKEEYDDCFDTDFPYEIEGLARFRCNAFMDRKGMGGVFRQIPVEILTAEALGISKAVLDLCFLKKGLVLVTGPTGSGKSTTLCAMIDYINKNRNLHILTIEDPIEFVHENKQCLVNQREVNEHTRSFSRALRAALREDPDIILVGEMRDLETISIAIETAETGHLVFGTLHTSTAASTVDRIVDQFPADRQEQIRTMLSTSLKGVVAQSLCKKIGGGRIAAKEILIVNSAVSNLIREGKVFQIPSIIQTSGNQGMELLNTALLKLVEAKSITPEEAYIHAVDKSGMVAAMKAKNITVNLAGKNDA